MHSTYATQVWGSRGSRRQSLMPSSNPTQSRNTVLLTPMVWMSQLHPHFKIELVTVHSHKKWDWIKLDINYSTNEESGGTSTWWIADSISCFSPASCGGGTLLFQTSCLPFHMWHKCANYGSITHRPLTIACSIKLQFSIPSVEPG